MPVSTSSSAMPSGRRANRPGRGFRRARRCRARERTPSASIRRDRASTAATSIRREKDELLARDDDVGATRARGVGAEEDEGLVDGVGPPAMISGRCAGSIRWASRIRSMHRSECRLMLETMNTSGMRPSSCICDGRKLRFHCCRTMRVLVESGIHQRRADGPDTRGDHPRVGKDERQHPRAMIERAGDHGRQVVFPRANPQALPNARQFARLEQFIAARASGKFHGEPLQKATARFAMARTQNRGVPRRALRMRIAAAGEHEA